MSDMKKMLESIDKLNVVDESTFQFDAERKTKRLEAPRSWGENAGNLAFDVLDIV